MALSCDSCPVRNRAACAVLSDQERNELARAGNTRNLKRGEMLFAAGDEDAACASLVTGALKVCTVDEEGNERILALIHPAGFVGELFSPFAHHDVVALGDSQLCVFAKQDMNNALERHPKLAQALLRRAQEDLLLTRDLLALSAKRSAGDRLGALLLSMARAASQSPCYPATEFELPLTRGEMAGMLGMTIETISRTLTKFERDGAIRRKGARGIELLDPARLGETLDGGLGLEA